MKILQLKMGLEGKDEIALSPGSLLNEARNERGDYNAQCSQPSENSPWFQWVREQWR